MLLLLLPPLVLSPAWHAVHRGRGDVHSKKHIACCCRCRLLGRREFRLSEDMYAQDSIELLKQSGIDFAQVGALRCAALMEGLPAACHSVAAPGSGCSNPSRSRLGWLRGLSGGSEAGAALQQRSWGDATGQGHTAPWLQLHSRLSLPSPVKPGAQHKPSKPGKKRRAAPRRARVQHESRGIDVRSFGELLVVSGVVLNEEVSA